MRALLCKMGVNLSLYRAAVHDQERQERGIVWANIKHNPNYVALSSRNNSEDASASSETSRLHGLLQGIAGTVPRIRASRKSSSDEAITVELGMEGSHTLAGLDDTLLQSNNEPQAFHVPSAKVGLETFTRSHFPVDGIRLGYLRSLNFPGDLTIYKICKQIIMPVTGPSASSYVEYLRTGDGSETIVKAKADVFVSYAWGYTWNVLLEALAELNDDDHIWMDLLIVNQHTAKQANLSEWLETFSGAIQVIGKVVFVLAPWRCPIPVTRAWCVFEILTALQTEVDRRILVPRSEFDDLVRSVKDGELAGGPRLEEAALLDVLRDINVMRARAHREEDREAIISKIKQRGVVDVNNVVLLPIKRWYLEVVRIVLTEEHTLPGSIERGNAYAALYALLEMLGRPTEALEASLMCLDSWQQAKVDPLTLALGLRQVGMAFSVVGEWASAVRYLRKCLHILQASDTSRASTSAKLFEHIQAVRELAIAQSQLGDLRSGIELARNAFELSRGICQHALDMLKTEGLLNRSSDQVIGHRSMLSVDDLRYGIRRRLQIYGDCATTLGALFQQNNQMAEAKTLFLSAFHVYRLCLGDDHPRMATARTNLALCLNREGRHADALQLCQDARFLVDRTLGSDHIEMAVVEHNLAMSAKLLADNNDVIADEKEREYLESLASECSDHAVHVWSSFLGDDHETTVTARDFWEDSQ